MKPLVLPLALLSAALLMVDLPVQAQDVYVDYDKDYDGSKVETFQWSRTAETSLEQEDPVLHSRIVNAIEHYLTEGGVEKVEINPDVYVTYHTNSKKNVDVNTTHYGYGYGGGWGYDPRWAGYPVAGVGVGAASTTVTTYSRGTLIIDIWDAKTKEMIWRGSATDVVPQDPRKAGDAIDRWLKKLVWEWERIKARKEKAKPKDEADSE